MHVYWYVMCSICSYNIFIFDMYHFCFIFAAPLSQRDVLNKHRVSIKKIVQIEKFVDIFISRGIISSEERGSVTIDSLLSTIESELECGIDGSLLEMLDAMKSYGTIGPRFLAEKIEEELHMLEGRLRPRVSVEFNISDRVDDMFLKLVHAVESALKRSNCEFTLLKSACIKPDTLSGKKNNLPTAFLDKVIATKTLNDLLALIISSPYCNWMNVRLLEKMVAFSCEVEAEQLITKYKKIVFSKKVKDVLQYIPNLEVSKDYYIKVREKWKKDLEDITVEDIANHWVQLESIFAIDKNEILLNNLIKGCVEINWFISINLVSHARLSAFKYWSDLEDVSHLSIGDHVIKNNQLEFTEEHISITTGTLT